MYHTNWTSFRGAGHNADGFPKNIKEEKRVTEYDGGEPSAYSTTIYEYDANGHLKKIIRPNNDIENYTYENGYLKNANGIQYDYDDRGNRISITDRNGNITSFEYDLLDRVTSDTNPLGEETIYTYEGKLLTQVSKGATGGDPSTGHITKYNHDPLDRVISVVKEGDAGNITISQYTYDSEDNILTVTDAQDNVTTFTYDLLNRPKTVKEPGKTVYTEYFYDALGNRTQVRDANGNSTEYTYDDLNRIIEVKDALENTTEYSYDALGNITMIRDARNNETTYEYDLLNQLIKEMKPLGQETNYSYDVKGRLDYKIDAKNQKIKYNYRALDDVITSIDYFNNAGDSTPAKTVTFGLDNNGNILSVIDDSIQGTAIYDYTYDAMNRVDIFTNNMLNKVLDYDYNSFGNRDKLTIKEGAILLHTIDYSYNKLEQLKSIGGPGGPTTLNYWPTGRIETKTFPNGVYGNYSYYPNGDIQSIIYKNSFDIELLTLNYSYDNASNIDTKNKDGILYDYGYDNLYQLAGVTVPSATAQNESFTYDEAGNRLSSIDKPNWIYDSNNRLTNYNNNEVAFGYDDNGNTTSKFEGAVVTGSYEYDFENRLISYSSGTVSVSYKYDPMGRRIEKDVDGSITKFLWDENVMIAELDESNNINRLYTYNPQTSEPISTTEDSNTYLYLNNHLMTPQKLIDSSQNVVWSADYKTFGEVTIDPTSIITNNLRFPGQYADEEAEGFYYNYHRTYQYYHGRYLQPDPLPSHLLVKVSRRRGQDILGFELLRKATLIPPFLIFSFKCGPYPYARNNPVRFKDPNGLFSFSWCSGNQGAEGCYLWGASCTTCECDIGEIYYDCLNDPGLVSTIIDCSTCVAVFSRTFYVDPSCAYCASGAAETGKCIYDACNCTTGLDVPPAKQCKCPEIRQGD